MTSVSFGDLFVFIRNGMNVSQDKSGRGLPITRIETISDATVDGSRVGYANLRESECRGWLLQPGDILFSHINSVEHIGKCAVYRGSPARLVHGMNLLCLRCDQSRLVPEFAKYLIRGSTFRAELSRFVKKAVNQASVSIGDLKTIRVVVPPLSEQRRIAEMLDRAEALRAKRRAALAQLDTLTQSIFLDMFGDPVTNPKGWQTAPLQEIALRGSEGLKRGPFGGTLKKEVFVSSGYKVFEQQHAIYKNCDAGRYFITEPKYRSMQGFAVQPGDFIVSCSGTVGRIFRLPPTAPKGVINQALLRIRIDASQVTPTFFEALFESVGFQRGLLGGARGTGIDNFPPMGQMRATKTVVPPIAVQHEFARRVAAVEQVKATHQASLAQLDALFGSLRHRAFQGEL